MRSVQVIAEAAARHLRVAAGAAELYRLAHLPRRVSSGAAIDAVGLPLPTLIVTVAISVRPSVSVTRRRAVTVAAAM